MKRNIAAVMQQAMKEKGMTQSDLSRASGIGRSSISQYLSGKNSPEPARIERLAEALGMDPEDLTGEAEEGSEKVIEELDRPSAKAIQRLSLREAAEYLGMSHETVKVGLIQGVFPWGYAIKTSANRYTFFINAKKFFEIERIGVKDGVRFG